MHSNVYKFIFMALCYSMYLINEIFNSRSYKVEIITVQLKPSLLLSTSLCVCTLTFITEALHFVATGSLYAYG